MNDSADILGIIRRSIHLHKIFLSAVESAFREDPLLRTVPPVIHTIKSRIKNEEHIEEKIKRKQRDGANITKDNVFEPITDVAGVRVIHLHQAQFTPIHEYVQRQIANGDWVLFENPMAYTWGP